MQVRMVAIVVSLVATGLAGASAAALAARGAAKPRPKVTVVALASVSLTPAQCVFERPCVFVAPDVNPETAAPGTVLTFSGRGWRPRSKVQADYGSF